MTAGGVLPMVVFFTDGDTTHDVMPFPDRASSQY